MATDGKVPIVESARAGFAFMQGSLRTIAPAAVVCAALQGLIEVARGGPIAALLALASLALVIAFLAFVYRLAVRQDSSGFYGLKFGKDELNLLGALLVVAFFFIIVVVVGIVVFSFALAMAAPQSGIDLESLQGDQSAVQAAMIAIMTGPAAWMVQIVLAALTALVLWIAARIGLWTAATIGEGKVMAFSTWEWTRGNAFRILAAMFIVALPLFLGIGLIVTGLGSAFGVGATAEGLLSGPAIPRALVAFLRALGQFLLLTPAMAGLAAYLYRGLRPPELAAPSAT